MLLYKKATYQLPIKVGPDKKKKNMIKVGARSWARTWRSSTKKELKKNLDDFLDFKFRPVRRHPQWSFRSFSQSP